MFGSYRGLPQQALYLIYPMIMPFVAFGMLLTEPKVLRRKNTRTQFFSSTNQNKLVHVKSYFFLQITNNNFHLTRRAIQPQQFSFFKKQGFSNSCVAHKQHIRHKGIIVDSSLMIVQLLILPDFRAKFVITQYQLRFCIFSAKTKRRLRQQLLLRLIDD